MFSTLLIFEQYSISTTTNFTRRWFINNVVHKLMRFNQIFRKRLHIHVIFHIARTLYNVSFDFIICSIINNNVVTTSTKNLSKFEHFISRTTSIHDSKNMQWHLHCTKINRQHKNLFVLHEWNKKTKKLHEKIKKLHEIWKIFKTNIISFVENKKISQKN